MYTVVMVGANVERAIPRKSAIKEECDFKEECDRRTRTLGLLGVFCGHRCAFRLLPSCVLAQNKTAVRHPHRHFALSHKVSTLLRFLDGFQGERTAFSPRVGTIRRARLRKAGTRCCSLSMERAWYGFGGVLRLQVADDGLQRTDIEMQITRFRSSRCSVGNEHRQFGRAGHPTPSHVWPSAHFDPPWSSGRHETAAVPSPGLRPVLALAQPEDANRGPESTYHNSETNVCTGVYRRTNGCTYYTMG